MKTMYRDIVCHLWEAICHKHPHLLVLETGFSTITMQQIMGLFWYRSVWSRIVAVYPQIPFPADFSPYGLWPVTKNESPL
jgi:hypothetical protein